MHGKPCTLTILSAKTVVQHKQHCNSTFTDPLAVSTADLILSVGNRRKLQNRCEEQLRCRDKAWILLVNGLCWLGQDCCCEAPACKSAAKSCTTKQTNTSVCMSFAQGHNMSTWAHANMSLERYVRHAVTQLAVRGSKAQCSRHHVHAKIARAG